jgi:hypothetical protein
LKKKFVNTTNEIGSLRDDNKKATANTGSLLISILLPCFDEGLVFVEEAGVVWELLLFDCAAAGGEAGAWGALVGMMLNDLSQSHFSLLRMVAPVVCSGLRIVGALVV